MIANIDWMQQQAQIKCEQQILEAGSQYLCWPSTPEGSHRAERPHSCAPSVEALDGKPGWMSRWCCVMKAGRGCAVYQSARSPPFRAYLQYSNTPAIKRTLGSELAITLMAK